jgi:hypothetical protein
MPPKLANGVLNIGAPFVGNISPTNATENRQNMLELSCFIGVVVLHPITRLAKGVHRHSVT